MKPLVIVLTLALAGCAATPQLEEQQPIGAKLPQYRAVYAAIDGDAEIRDRDGYLATSARLLREFVDDIAALGKSASIGPAPREGKALEAHLQVTDFNYVSTAGRILAGILVGHATLAVTMTLKDPATGAVIGVVSASDSSSHLQGVFGADTDRQVQAMAQELASKFESLGAGGPASARMARAQASAAEAAPGTVTLADLESLMQRKQALPQLVVRATAASSPGERALSPSELYEKAAPSIWVVDALDADRHPLASTSAVAVAGRHLATTCDALANASALEVRHGAQAHGASLQYADVERDLCLLALDEGQASPVDLSPPASAKVGQRIYAITFADKLGISLDEGLLSAMQADDPALPPLRATLALAPGTSGGGLFDDQGRLIGLLRSNVARGELPPNLHFALPDAWIAETPARAERQLAKADTERALRPKTGVFPAPGTRWSYRFTDRIDDNRARNFSVQLKSADANAVSELVQSGGSSEDDRFDAREIDFHLKRIDGEGVFELAPYLLAEIPNPSLPLPRNPHSYLRTNLSDGWKLRVTAVQPEPVMVAAGRFDAIRVQVIGENQTPVPTTMRHGRQLRRVQRFQYIAWYAPAIGRYVQAQHKTFNRFGDAVADERVELVRFEPGSASAR